MRTVYTSVADISRNHLSVNIVVAILHNSFVPLHSSWEHLDADDAVGELVVGDSTGSVNVLVTKRHIAALGLSEASHGEFPAIVIKNVLPVVFFGRLRLELNRFSSVCGRHICGVSVHVGNNISLVDHDRIGKILVS